MKTVRQFATAEAARDALSQLILKLGSLAESQQIKLIIYFDEAHPLTKAVPKNDNEKTLYDFLCLCLNQFLDFPIFCILLRYTRNGGSKTCLSVHHYYEPHLGIRFLSMVSCKYYLHSTPLLFITIYTYRLPLQLLSVVLIAPD